MGFGDFLSAGAILNPVGMIGTGAAMGGSILNYIGQKKTNEANQAMAQNQMNFQEDMSNTAYQRAMADMRKAGLNPMLAFSQGGASTPSGASAVMGNELGQLGQGVQTGVANAMESIRLNNQTGVAQADINQKDAQAQLFSERLKTERTNQVLNQSTALKNQHELPSIKSKAHSARAEAELRKAEAELRKKTLYIDKAKDYLKTGLDVFKTLKGKPGTGQFIERPSNRYIESSGPSGRYKDFRSNTNYKSKYDKDGYVRDDVPF